MSTSTITSKGQVTIPKRVREQLGLKVGDRLAFRVDREGRLVVEPESPSPLGAVPGLLRHLVRDRPATVQEMDDAIGRHVRQKFREAVRR